VDAESPLGHVSRGQQAGLAGAEGAQVVSTQSLRQARVQRRHNVVEQVQHTVKVLGRRSAVTEDDGSLIASALGVDNAKRASSTVFTLTFPSLTYFPVYLSSARTRKQVYMLHQFSHKMRS
jgi:hypothetical protein